MKDLAIVGAGIGGCSAAYFAAKSLQGLNVTIYDSQNRVGGRILTYNSAGASMELGAAFFTGFNSTLLNIVKAEKLKIGPFQERKDFAVWNGKKLAFRSNKQSFATGLKLLAKYKLSIERTFLLLKKVKGQLAKLYRETLKNPANMDEIFESTSLDEWHKKPFSDILIERGVSQEFIDEIITPITRTIYTQNADLGGFAGISSLIGVTSGATYRMAEGNSTLPVHLAKTSNARIKLREKVDVIEKMPDGTYRLFTAKDIAVFDCVIIAAPVELADIKFDGVSVPGWEHHPYQAVYRKIMRGVLNPEYFGLKNTEAPPAIILTTRDTDPITYYSILKKDNGESLVMISSSEPLNYNAFNSVFKNGGASVFEHCWKAAYPKFKPITRLPPTRIDKRLIYAGATEAAVSSMETSALSALNAVRMLREEHPN